MFSKKPTALPDPAVAELRSRLEACNALNETINLGLEQAKARNAELEAALEMVPWAPRPGISGGTYHSDRGADATWAALDERAEQEAAAFRAHPGYRAVLDVLEARLLGIMRRWRSTDNAAEIASLHVYARCYEDMLATLEGKTSLRDRKEAFARREAKSEQERERLPAMAAAGRSPFLR